jgi:predicted RNase H-like HicB family nuclease
MQSNKVIVDIYYSGRNFSACIPILPGCVATGNTPKEVNQRMKEAIDLHVKSSMEDGDYIAPIFREAYELVFHFNAEAV